MILRPPKNFNEYSVSVPMSIDWMLKTLQKVVKGENVVTKIIAGTNITISPVSGVGQVTINATGGGVTPTLAQVTTAGNTTTNAITVGNINANGQIVTRGATLPSFAGDGSISVGGTNISGNAGVLIGVQIPYVPFAFGGHFIGYSNQTNPKWLIGISRGIAQENALVYYEDSAAANPRLAIFPGGNVAINSTTDAGYKLDVNGTTRLQGLVNGFVSLNTSTKGLLVLNDNNDQNRGVIVYQNNSGPQAAAMQFFKSRGTYASPTAVTTGDILGAFVFNAYTSSYSNDRSLFGATMSSTNGISQYFITGTTNGNYTPNLLIAENGNVVIGPLGGTIITTLTLPTAKFQVTGSITAASLLAQGVYFNNTLVAAANNDVLVGLDINPTFTNGAFTGISDIPLRITNNVKNTGGGIGMMALQGGNGTGATAFPWVDIRNTDATNNKVQFTIGGGTPYGSQTRTHSFGTDVNGTGLNDFYIYKGSTNSAVFIIAATGNVIIGNSGISYSDAGYKLDVNGTARVSGALTSNYFTSDSFGIGINTATQNFLDTRLFVNGNIMLKANGVTSTGIIFPAPTTAAYAFKIETLSDRLLTFKSDYTNSSPTFPNTIMTLSGITYNVIIGGGTDNKAKFQVYGSITASSALAQGVYFNNTLVAAANNDVLVGLDINPTFTSGAFTGLGKIAARIQSGALLVGTTLLNTDVISFPVQVNGSSQNIGAVWRNALSTGYTSFRFYNDQNLNTRAMEMGYAGSAYPSAIVTGGVTGESAYLTTTGAYPLQLGTNNTARFIVFSNGNVGVGTNTDAGQKLQVSGNIFIKGTDSLSSTKVFEVQNGAGASVMDFRNATYAFFGCGQGGGSNSGFIFRYDNTSYVQFTGYNYGAGAGAYKPILMDTDVVGRGQGIFINFGVSTNTPPNSDTEFAVRGRGAGGATYAARFRDSSNNDVFAIKDDGQLETLGITGYTGTLSIPGNPPGSNTITITNGLITNIA